MSYYYVRNLLDDVTGIIDSVGTLVVQYTYDSWGKVLSTTGSMKDTVGTLNPIRYRGYYYDKETGLYYLQSRYYDPETGRFISPDVVAEGGNLYTYCQNDPVNRSDESGCLSRLTREEKQITVITLAVVTIVVVAAVTSSTAGTVLPVIVGSGLGFVSNFSLSVVAQGAKYGAVDWEQAVVDGAIGAVMGGFSGTALGRMGMAIAGAATSFTGSIANDWIAGNGISISKAALAGVVGGAIGATTTGAQYKMTGTRKAALALQDQVAKQTLNGNYGPKTAQALDNLTAKLVKIVTKDLNKAAIKRLFANFSLEVAVYQSLMFV